MNIRYPNITAPTEKEQISQIRSYLHQLVEQLNWALSTLEPGTASASAEQPATSGITEEAFKELKVLITQSSAMLDTYYEKINNRLKGQYVSQTAFETYQQESEEAMDGKYVAQTDFDAYKQEVAKDFDDLGNQYVTQAVFDAYKQEVSGNFAGLDSKFVSQSSFDVFTQENAQTILKMQQDIATLQQKTDATQETGGE